MSGRPGGDSASEKTVQVGKLETASIGTNRIDRFLSILGKRSGSDFHLAVGSPPIIRIDGEIERIRYRTLTEGDFYNLVSPITPENLWKAFQETGDVDFAYQMGREARFRVNLLRQERGSAAVFRLIPARVPTAWRSSSGPRSRNPPKSWNCKWQNRARWITQSAYLFRLLQPA